MRLAILLSMIAITLVVCRWAPEMSAGESTGVVLALPPKAGELVGQPDEPTAMEVKLLPSDTGFAKMIYHTNTDVDGSREIVRTTIVLAGAERRSIHRPEVCLTGQGWTIEDECTRTVTMQDGQALRVRDLLIRRSPAGSSGDVQRAHYVYWFVGADTTTPSHFARIWHTTWDSVFRNVNHRWAYVSMFATVTAGQSPALTRERARSSDETLDLLSCVIRDTVPHFQKSYARQTMSLQ